MLLGSPPSFLNNWECSILPPPKGQLPEPTYLPVPELDQVGKLRPRDWKELHQGHRANHQHFSLNPRDLKFGIWPCEPGRVQGNASEGPSPQWLPLPMDEAQGFSSLFTNFFDHLSSKYTKSCPTPGPLHLLLQMLESLLCVPTWLTPSPSGSLSSRRGLSICLVWRILPIPGMFIERHFSQVAFMQMYPYPCSVSYRKEKTVSWAPGWLHVHRKSACHGVRVGPSSSSFTKLCCRLCQHRAGTFSLVQGVPWAPHDPATNLTVLPVY